MKIGPIVLSNPLRLAPMAGITDIPFRVVARECGSSLSTSEEIDAKALLIGSQRTLRTASYLHEERPIAMQLLGCDPENLAQAAKRLEEEGTDIIDLNMGCPVPKITRKGQGAALMQNPLLAAAIFRAMRSAIRIPLTIKIRGGWDDEHLNAPAIARVAEGEGVDAITIHPRTRSQRFTGKAPWHIIAEVAQAVKIPVTGNGDVRSQADAQRMMEETGVQSVMIGRGALGRPWIFDPTFERLNSASQAAYKVRVIQRHRDLIFKHLPERSSFVQLKKNLVWYMMGIPNAASIRHQIFLSKDPETAWNIFEKHWPADGQRWASKSFIIKRSEH